MTPNELQQAIEANTQAIAALNQAVNFLVTEAIRPAVQQSSANYERLESIASIVADIAQQMAQSSQTLSSLVELSTVQQQQIAANAQQIAQNSQAISSLVELITVNQQQIAANAQQIAANTEAMTALTERLIAFDSRLEETRNLVADNGSQIAQLRVVQQQSAIQQDRNAQAIFELIEENRAFRESQQSQLAAIIGNGRRIDRLEQQAS